MGKRIKFSQFFVIFAVVFISLSILIGLIHNMFLQKVEYTEEEVEVTNCTQKNNYEYNEIITNKIEFLPLTLEEMKTAKNELEGRRKELRKICNTFDKINIDLKNVIPNMIIDKKHELSWCPIYKAASSAWMQYFSVLGGVMTEATMDLIRKNIIQINTIVRQTFPPEANVTEAYQKMSQTKKFLIVRHPLERLVSAYRDKLERLDGREYYYKRFGRRITYKYRRYRMPNETRLEPTFHEFLRFIVDEKYFDEHWAPYFDTCAPCFIHYDYILKFDTFERDTSFLIQELNLDVFLGKRFDLKNINPQGSTTHSTMEKYMLGIPRTLLDGIYKIYEKDFKLFSYLLI